MGTNITTIVIAIIGVAGTLTAPLLTQLAASRTKQSELNMQRAVKEVELEESRRDEAFKERRAVYVSLHSAARQYLGELRRDLRTLVGRDLTDVERAELAEARQHFREVYSNAQMILPDRVLDYARSASGALGEAYGKLRRLDARLAPDNPDISTAPDRSEAIEEARIFCRTQVYDQIAELRDIMRFDLGVSTSDNTSLPVIFHNISDELSPDD
jgi:type II secretory pathway pseudopilin PulG